MPPAPLAELTWAKTHHLDLSVALLAHACSRVGAMRATWPCPAPPPVQRTRANGILTLSTSLHACTRACALTLSEHDRALAATLNCPIDPGARSYKRGPSPCILSVPPPLPLSSKLSLPHHLYFPPLRRCQAASPHLSPRAQVLELRKAPELLPV
jgi:hypothetical protein